MTAVGVALLSVGGVALLVGSVARALEGLSGLSEDQAAGAKRLRVGLYLGGALCLAAGLVTLGVK